MSHDDSLTNNMNHGYKRKHCNHQSRNDWILIIAEPNIIIDEEEYKNKEIYWNLFHMGLITLTNY